MRSQMASFSSSSSSFRLSRSSMCSRADFLSASVDCGSWSVAWSCSLASMFRAIPASLASATSPALGPIYPRSVLGISGFRLSPSSRSVYVALLLLINATVIVPSLFLLVMNSFILACWNCLWNSSTASSCSISRLTRGIYSPRLASHDARFCHSISLSLMGSRKNRSPSLRPNLLHHASWCSSCLGCNSFQSVKGALMSSSSSSSGSKSGYS